MQVSKLTVVSLLVALITVSTPAAAGIAVVVNPSNPTDSLDKQTLSRIFLGRASTFPSGDKVVPLNQSGDSAARSAFEEGLLGKSTSQMKAYWAKQLFSGQGRPPEEIGGDSDVISRVSSDTAAIGYIDASAVTDAVKVVYSE